MNDPGFTRLRRELDEAITFDDLGKSRSLVAEGLQRAQQDEIPGEVMYFRAQEAIIEGMFTEAIVMLEQALVFNPSDGAAYNDIALCMVEMGRLEGVLDIFDQGIAVEPDYATIHHNKGWFLNKIGKTSQALACFEQALLLEPGRVVTWENMADAYEEQGRLPEALNAYKKALALLKKPSSRIRAQLQAEIDRLT
ncbi:MAG: tetratricopeptide repeat protein [Candidatus Omnitrophica bacterium]|nr:tetratricopeptide repeat protein [Candidatus Omnitrophota bacterium]